jgi:hypothetical protein
MFSHGWTRIHKQFSEGISGEESAGFVRVGGQSDTPASVALAISIKAGEIATCYQKRRKAIRRLEEQQVWALADVLLNALRMSDLLCIPDLCGLVWWKMGKMERRFRNQARSVRGQTARRAA